ncbi:MAG TPA: hypothetical protein VFT90_15635 [Chryseosolibacter sp.]|nr:hypothetical protein [Chryseosolibacter sp.]
MKCSEIEKDIYLYDELASPERNRIDAHVSTCAHCMQVLKALRDARKAVALHQSETPLLPNHAAMTHRIMDGIQATQRSKHPQLKEVFRRMIAAPVRHHMALLSIVLVLFFATEYGSGMGKQKIVKQYRGLPGRKTELNIAAFHTAFFETRKEGNQSSHGIADCVARCLDAPTSECKPCAEKLAKP